MMKPPLAALLVLAAFPALLPAQAPAPVPVPAAPLLRPGAHVRIQAARLGPGWTKGVVAGARVGGKLCQGIAVEQKDATGHPLLVLFKGVQKLEVDRRTNTDVLTIGLDQPADSDWATVDVTRLVAGDPCSR